MASSYIKENNKIYYAPGEVNEARSYGECAGATTGDNKMIEFTVITPKMIRNYGNDAITIDFLGVNVKQEGHSVDGLDSAAKNNGIDIVNTYTVGCYAIGNTLQMSLRRKDGAELSNAVAYSSCTVSVRLGFTVN